MKRFRKIFIRLLFIIPILTLLGVQILDMAVSRAAKSRLYDQVSAVPPHKVGLLLGTAKILGNGRVNLYYKYRIQAAVELYQAGKVSYFLVSGDNGSKYYDEPSTIKADLIAAGIPASKIFLDYAGFRTLDSVVRAKKVFGQSKLVVISQPFHNERALFLARFKGIEAVGFNARRVSPKYGYKVLLREKLARVKMVLDLLIGKGPKYLGPKVEIK